MPGAARLALGQGTASAAALQEQAPPAIIYSFNLTLQVSDGYAVLSLLPVPLGPDKKGRSIRKTLPLEPLPDKVLKALIGDLLGDGHLRVMYKDSKDKIIGNAHYAMTLKNYDYAYYLWKDIYSPICTTTPLRPWPNPRII